MFGVRHHVLTMLAGIPAGVIAGVTESTSGSGTDLSWLAPFGAAAPFAGLALLQMNRAQNKLDKQEAEHKAELAETEKEHRTDCARRDDEIRALRERSEARERELVLRFGNIIYDSALLYKEGNTALGQIARQVETATVREARSSEIAPSQGDMAEVLAKLEELTEAMHRGAE